MEVAAGHLDTPVPSCPGFSVERLLRHCAAVCLNWRSYLVENGPVRAEGPAFEGEAGAAFADAHGALLSELASRDPDQPTWTWGSDQHVRFAYRRVAQELSIHRWDFENAVGAALPIDVALAADGVQEFLDEFTPKREGARSKGAAELFAGDGERVRFECTDADASWTLIARPDRFEAGDDRDADVVARATASDLDLFVWGRIGPDALEISGDASLLDRWHERVKI